MEENKNVDTTMDTSMKLVDRTKKKKVKPWVIILIVAVIAVLVVAGVALSKAMEMVKGIGTPVETTEVVKGDIAQSVETSGTVASEEVKTYFANVAAEIDTLNVMAGQPVKQGDVLVTYNTETLEEALQQSDLETKISTYGADAAIVSIDASQKKAADASVDYEEAKKYVAHYTECVGQASSQLQEASRLAAKQGELSGEIEKLNGVLAAKPENKKAQKKLEKVEEELKQVTKDLKKYDVEALQATLETCSGDLAEYKALMKEYEMTKESDPTASLNKAQQQLMKESAQLSKTKAAEQLAEAKEGVKAEFSGIVSEVTAVEGQMTMDGAALFTIQNSEALKVTIPATKNDVVKIAVGQNANIKIGEKEYKGTVSAVSRIAAVNASGTSTINVDVHVDNPDDSIILGMDAKIEIETAEEKDVLIIPLASVNYSSDSVFCYVLADGKIEKRDIETGICDDENIQVLSGLKEGDKVVTNVTSAIQEGMKAMEMPSGSAASDAEDSDTDGAEAETEE